MGTSSNIDKNKKERIGEIGYNKYGSQMIVKEYNGCNDILVYFPDFNYSIKSTYNNFKKKTTQSPFDRTICCIGFLGIGKYTATIPPIKRPTKQYDAWRSMLRRCYYKTKLHTTYYGIVTVCEEWHNFQNFAKWYDENYYEIDNQTMCVDKDILIKGNKIYSPKNCVFVPNNINCLFTKDTANRGKYPIGVYMQFNKYKAQCSDYESFGKQKGLGMYNTVEEAFNVYKIFKESVIQRIADKFKSQIPKTLYEAMYSYKVEITD